MVLFNLYENKNMKEYLDNSYTNPEHDGHQEREMREAVKMVSRDFLNTFKYSQGDPTLQTLLTTLVRDQYEHIDKGAREAIPRALTIVSSRVGNFAVPGKHKIIDDTFRWNEYNRAFDEFRKSLVKPDYMPSSLPVDRPERLLYMADRIERRDRYFIAQGRPNRKTDGELYDSHLRTYILDGRDTYSDAFNAIFHDARQQLVSVYPQTGLDVLQEEWEHYHPEQEFYPPAFMEEVLNSKESHP
jgi:hypothetical protein